MSEPETLRVATLNLWHREGPWPARAALIREELERLAPDVVGLQEVLAFTDGDGRTENQAGELAAGLGYELVYAPAAELGGGLTLGNALLTRHPVLEHAHSALPTRPEEPGRGVGFLLTETPWGRLPVFVTHLSWELDAGATRVAQVRALTDWLSARAPLGKGALPAIVVGDFNAEPDSDEIRFLTGRHVLEGRSVYFADAWRYEGEGPGYTFDRRNAYAARVSEPPRRIDYIFVRGPDRARRGEPLRARVCFDAPRDGVWPSDHFGVVADVVVRPRGLGDAG